ncbi:hypothetical protein [Calycomorphotria hydatis]|uniref:hypothetical protein n=1 Tax=Calycomorphotria hydatis TaxID=2528027 RepID=UPI0011A799D0|nr:hypothetical protein [Calycomorphotria hydatis]
MYAIQFSPSKVEGVTGVTEVAIYGDRIELIGEQETLSYAFYEFARWPKPVVLWKLLRVLGVQNRPPIVAEKDWFHPPAEMYIEFYTKPRIKVFMPLDESKEPYADSYFFRIQEVILSGGYTVYDLG